VKDLRTDVIKTKLKILKMFSKPQEVTNKEIIYSKEHSICLICKGNVSKLNMLTCHKCSVLYCQNCVRILGDLENACWVCNTPFYKKKPSKPYKKEEQKEKIKVTGEIHPKKTDGKKILT